MRTSSSSPPALAALRMVVAVILVAAAAARAAEPDAAALRAIVADAVGGHAGPASVAFADQAKRLTVETNDGCRDGVSPPEPLRAAFRDVAAAWGRLALLAPGPDNPVYRSDGEAVAELLRALTTQADVLRTLIILPPLGRAPDEAKPSRLFLRFAPATKPYLVGAIDGLARSRRHGAGARARGWCAIRPRCGTARIANGGGDGGGAAVGSGCGDHRSAGARQAGDCGAGAGRVHPRRQRADRPGVRPEVRIQCARWRLIAARCCAPRPGWVSARSASAASAGPPSGGWARQPKAAVTSPPARSRTGATWPPSSTWTRATGRSCRCRDADTMWRLGRWRLPSDLADLSIRHLALDRRGNVWFGCQWEGPAEIKPPLLGRLRTNGALEMVATDEIGGNLANYVGSLASDRAGTLIAASSPRAGSVAILDAAAARILARTSAAVSGASGWGN